MIAPNHIRAAGLVLLAFVVAGHAARAQDFSPFVETTGWGAYDLYRDTLLCNAVLARAMAGEADRERQPRLEQGVAYTAGFALFLLETGDVVDPGGTILAPESFSGDRQRSDADWQAILLSLDGGGIAAEAETARCLRLYGHPWE